MSHRFVWAGLLCAVSAMAGPPLTTIQDVLYKADGTRFSGMLTISWNSFEAPDSSNITTQSTTVRVVDGNLRVQLVPNSTAPATYAVKYNSDGRVQFSETWVVPSATRTLRVRDVRITTGNQAGDDTGSGTPGPVAEGDVVGLADDLATRPVKSGTYATSRTVYVNSQGALQTVAGNPGDCVKVDGSTGPCGDVSTAYADGDTPSGIVDGSNVSFSLTSVPAPVTSLMLYRNGVLLKAGQDFTLTSRNLTFAAAMTPQPGDTLTASYRLSSTSAAVPQPYPLAQVLCNATGAATPASSLTRLGYCTIPAGLLAPGDRVELRYEWTHGGPASGFHTEVRWGATTVAARDATAAETMVAARLDAALLASGAHLSWQSWGTALSLAAGVGAAGDAYSGGITVEFWGNLSAAGGDTLTLTNFTVTRFP